MNGASVRAEQKAQAFVTKRLLVSYTDVSKPRDEFWPYASGPVFGGIDCLRVDRL